MAANINRVVLVGNLTRDPEMKHLPSGTALCSLRIAVNTRRKDESGSGRTSRTISTCPSGVTRARVARSTSPRAVRSRSTAGSSGASGRRTDGSGKRQAVEIVADNVQFLGSRGDSDSGGGAFVPAGAAQQSGADFPGSPTDDDIPF